MVATGSADSGQKGLERTGPQHGGVGSTEDDGVEPRAIVGGNDGTRDNEVRRRECRLRPGRPRPGCAHGGFEGFIDVCDARE